MEDDENYFPMKLLGICKNNHVKNHKATAYSLSQSAG
ncbi:hypothetical protein B0H39_002230 [Clostridium beijerinckii]|nr:hypothetical protein [Clostridium beijerinckii]NOW84349.1 hypothetical protein [Clostridium beijerinckii]